MATLAVLPAPCQPPGSHVCERHEVASVAMEERAPPHQPWGQAGDKSPDVLAAHVARAQPWQEGAVVVALVLSGI